MAEGNVALHIRDEYNMPSTIVDAEGHHHSPCSCMRKYYYPHAPSLGIHLILLVVVSLTLASCASSAQLVNETATGGTVLYSYVEEQDVLTSPGRNDALLLLEEKCPAGYRVAREGEVPRVDQAVDRAWMGQLSRDGQVSRERRWAIQFSCK